MRTAFLLFLAILLGVLLGIGVATLRIRSAIPKPKPGASGSDSPTLEHSADRTPKLVVDALLYNFGDLDIASSGSHDFTFANRGDGPLKLRTGAVSCRCAATKLAGDEIPPGGAMKVTLTWRSAGKVGPYRQTAEVLTNDPERPSVTLTVAGRITAAAQLAPAELAFGSISTTETATLQTRLLGHLDKPLRISGYKWANAETARYFDVSTRPLSNVELKESDAKSGLLATVNVRPGMPSGPIQQGLVFQTNLNARPTLALPIHGVVVGEIAVVGPGWDADASLLTLGIVSSNVGLLQQLSLVVRGSAGKDVTFSVARVVPDFLKVSLGHRSDINGGAAFRTPLWVEVPRGSRAARYLGAGRGGLGEILLETSHPRVSKLRIPVQVAVQE